MCFNCEDLLWKLTFSVVFYTNKSIPVPEVISTVSIISESNTHVKWNKQIWLRCGFNSFFVQQCSCRWRQKLIWSCGYTDNAVLDNSIHLWNKVKPLPSTASGLWMSPIPLLRRHVCERCSLILYYNSSLAVRPHYVKTLNVRSGCEW